MTYNPLVVVLERNRIIYIPNRILYYYILGLYKLFYVRKVRKHKT